MSLDADSIKSMLKPGDKKRLLTSEEIEYMCSKLNIPHPGIKEVVDLVNDQLKSDVRRKLTKIEIYESFIPTYFQFIENTFLRSLEEAGAPIGPRASDGIGQQATQSLLNSFHQAGSSKSGGPDGIRENISISHKRKAPYTYINFWNDYYTLEEVMDLKTEFIGISVADLAESILPVNINIRDHMIDISEVTSIEDGKYLLEQGCYWWYPLSNIDGIYNEVERTAVRIKLDVMKLFEFKITTTMIANVISNYEFSITKPKGEASGKETKEKFSVVPVPSPTYEGIIDLFLTSEKSASEDDVKKDFFMTTAIASGEFKNIIISGIPGIKIFYPVSKSTLSIVRDIEEVPEGAMLYLRDVRFSGVPVSKLIKLINAAGLETDEYDLFNENPLEFHSHKIMKEKRKRVIVKARILEKEFDGDYTYNVSTNNVKVESHTATNHFFSVNSVEVLEENIICYLILNKKPNYYYLNKKSVVEVDDYEQLVAIIDECNDGNKDLIKEFIPEVDSKGNLGMLDYKEKGVPMSRNFASFPVKCQDGKTYYVGICRFKIASYDLTVNTDFINSGINCCKLDDVINAYFSEPEFSIPNDFRLPDIETVESIKEFPSGILIKSKIFFRDELDPYDKDGKKIEKSPIDRFRIMINSNVDDPRLLDHVYAETQGSALDEICSHHLVDPRRSYCNDFYATLDIFGIEGLYNLLAFELIDIVNKEGYINVEYPKLVAATTTANGVNPMTSQGITAQRRGILSQITFDNAAKYLAESARVGKYETTNNVSTSIFIGNECTTGNGYVDVRLNETKISIMSPKRDYKGTELRERDDEEDPYYEEVMNLLEVKFAKFPKVKWVIDNFISRDIMYYVDCGISHLTSIINPKINPIDTTRFCKDILPYFPRIVPVQR